MRGTSAFESLRRWLGNGRTVVVGVGNEDRGDDAAGLVVARRLSGEGLPAVVAGDVPESYTDVIRSSGCQNVLFVDAVDFGGQPGDIALLEADDLVDNRYDTHRPSLRLVMMYLTEAAGLRCALVGIQPACVRWGHGLSEGLEQSVELVAALLCEILTE